jgi:hypothetical protein
MGYRITYKKHISRSDVRTMPEAVFIFGDNDQRSGFGGQAKEMRGEPNAIGIRVKKTPSRDTNAYYSDREYDENVRKINEDIDTIQAHIVPGSCIVFPEDGIGTGLARLNQTAPKTFEYLTRSLNEKFGIDNPHRNIYMDS